VCSLKFNPQYNNKNKNTKTNSTIRKIKQYKQNTGFYGQDTGFRYHVFLAVGLE
jgi:hypothetical protein